MRIEWVILIIAIIVGLAWKSGIKLPKPGGNAIGQWFKNITGNLSWLLAIGGQVFCLILIWQCFPEFFGHWLKTNGFWFIQLGFVVSVILLKYAKPQVVGVVALLLTLTCLLVSMVSARYEMIPLQTEVATTLPRLSTERRWEPTVPVVVATPDKVSNPTPIPFGKDFWIDTKGNVFCFKNGRPFLWNGKHLILKPGDTNIPFGTDCQSLAFQSAEPNNVIVVIHLREH